MSRLFKTRLQVRVGDLNYGNHLANESLASFANEVRVQFLKDLGYKTELDIEGLSLIMAENSLKFKAESIHGDTLIAKATITDLKRVSFILNITFYKSNDALVAEYTAVMLFFSYKEHNVCSIPNGFREKLDV